jgi:drug/metabolite transporter (DMT)-like permease
VVEALALLASLLWGGADYAGGKLARTARLLTILTLSQGAGLLLLLVLVAAGVDGLPDGRGWAYGAGAGLAGAVALSAFYRALAVGRMSVVAPLAALGAALPVVTGLVAGERPSALTAAGLLVAGVGAVLASGPELGLGGVARQAVGLALVAAVGFGAVLVLTAEAVEGGTLGGLLAMRGTATACYLLAALVTRTSITPPRSVRRVAPVVGLADLGAVAAYAVSSRSGLVAVVAVLASLYPVVTVLLARAVDGERVAPVQQVGVVAALVGVVLVASGGAG